MKFFLDTANIDEIKRISYLGLVDGVTTNPTIISREGKDFKSLIKEICSIVDGPVSAEVISTDCEGMVQEAEEISKWSSNVVVKIPLTEDGLEAVNILSKKGIKTNVTLVFTVAQGLMAAKAGATYISPFVGRLDDIASDGIDLIKKLKKILTEYNYDTKIIAASIRNIKHLENSALSGAHIATIPGTLFSKLWQHPLTDSGIQQFLDDWKKYDEHK